MTIGSKFHHMSSFFPRFHQALLSDRGLLRRFARQSRRWQIAFFFLGAALLVMIAAARAWPAPIRSVDDEQSRIDVALPPLPAGQPFVQTFRPKRDGLVEVELLLARLAEGTEGDVTLRLHDDTGHLVAAQSWPVSSLTHNQPLTLRFPPQPASSGRRYELALVGTGISSCTPTEQSGNFRNVLPPPEGEGRGGGLSYATEDAICNRTSRFPFSFWAYSADVYAGGALTVANSAAHDLRFVTRYQLLPLSAASSADADLARYGGLFLLALALMLLPGALLLLLLEPEWPRRDAGLWWGVALALGVAAWPLLWYWLTLAGGRWRPWSLVAVLAGGWLAVILLWRRKGARPQPRAVLAHLPLLAILALALVLRLLAVRDLAFPPWVDPTRHALITRVMADGGQIVRDYRPFLPVERFPYHFGFHTLPAGLTLLGVPDLPGLLLMLGQLLNALVTLTVYAAAMLVTRRRVAALLAAFLVALPFYFPAYYASWGRFTQLNGVLLLPLLLALTWVALEERAARRRLWLPVAVLAAGLALIHFRVFLIYLPFAAIAWLIAGRSPEKSPSTSPSTLLAKAALLFKAALLALLLAGPRLWELFRMTQAMGTGVVTGAPTTYNDFPWGYVVVGWERRFLAAGGIAFLLVIAPALRGRSWARFALTLAAWSSAVLLLIFYAPATWLLNLNSAYIVFFVPLALLLGAAGGALEAWWRRQGALWAAPAYGLMGAGLALLALFGVRQQISVLNPDTQLARPADAAGIAWVEEHVPTDATVAVNSWHWLGATWAGSDGGAWLLPLTERATTTPPADYVYSREMVREVAAFNEAAQAVEDWSDPEAVRWLQEEGVTHIFVGKRGGYFDPAQLAANSLLTALYDRDGVFVFAFEPGSIGISGRNGENERRFELSD